MNNLCVAHRGFSSIAPENTMAAFLLAMEQPEVQWMELDVQLSRDGVPVVIHDFTFDRTTNGKGLVRETDWSEIQQLDAGAWKEKPTRASEFLLLVRCWIVAVAKCD